MLGRLVNSNYKIRTAGDDSFKVIGFVDGVWWALIVSVDFKRLITVRRAHKDEI